MSNLIEVNFVVEKPSLKELISYFRRFPYFDNKVLPVLLFMYFCSAGYLVLEDIRYFIDIGAFNWHLLQFSSQVNIIGLIAAVAALFITKITVYGLWKRVYLNARCALVFDLNTATLSFENQHESGTHRSEMSFSFFNDAVASPQFIYLRSNKKLSTVMLFLKKEAITYADFERLQEAVSCLQKLKLDPKEFKQEPLTHES
jgi:hypothetical protein